MLQKYLKLRMNAVRIQQMIFRNWQEYYKLLWVTVGFLFVLGTRCSTAAFPK